MQSSYAAASELTANMARSGGRAPVARIRGGAGRQPPVGRQEQLVPRHHVWGRPRLVVQRISFFRASHPPKCASGELRRVDGHSAGRQAGSCPGPSPRASCMEVSVDASLSIWPTARTRGPVSWSDGLTTPYKITMRLPADYSLPASQCWPGHEGTQNAHSAGGVSICNRMAGLLGTVAASRVHFGGGYLGDRAARPASRRSRG